MTDLITSRTSSTKSLLERVEDALLPLINLVFLLLMFFIVAGHLTNGSLPDLPDATVNGPQKAAEPDLIVTADGDWRVGSRVVDTENLLNELPARGRGEPLRVAAARSLTMADLTDLFRLLEHGGYDDVLLLTEPGS